MTQSVPYGMVAGQRHELPGITVPDAPPPPDDINLDAPQQAPYGMTPGVRHVLPGITRLPPPDVAPELDPAQQPKVFGQYGIEVADPATGKKMVFHSNVEDSLQNRGKSISALGKALMDHAHTDTEKAAAERAAAWGIAQVDTDVPLEHVIQSMDGSYRKDTGYEAAISKQALANQGKLDAVHARFPWGTGGGGATGPTKQDKFDLQETQGQTADLEKLVEAERKNYDFKVNRQAMVEMEQSMAKMRSGNALAQRVAVMEELKRLSGKQQTEREQAAIANAAGVLQRWENDLRLKIPGADPQLTLEYRRQFEDASNIAQQVLQQTMQEMGSAAVNALQTSPFYQRMSPEERALAERHVKGRVSGTFDAPQEQGLALPAPAKPAPKKYKIGDIVK